jgi:hypothetical protein
MEQEQPGEPTPQPKKNKKHYLVAAVLLIAGFLVFSAGASIFYYNQGTDSDGYVYSNVYHAHTTTNAFILYMNEYKIGFWGFLGAENIAQIKFVVTNQNPAQELFTGYATTAASEPYRESFQCEFPTFWTWYAQPYYAEININTTLVQGNGTPTTLPQAQTFWVTSAQSTDTATMTYLPQHEQYVWFIMNTDGSANITADIQIGFKSPILTILPWICIPIGLLLLLVGMYFLIRKKKTSTKTE